MELIEYKYITRNPHHNFRVLVQRWTLIWYKATQVQFLQRAQIKKRSRRKRCTAMQKPRFWSIRRPHEGVLECKYITFNLSTSSEFWCGAKHFNINKNLNYLIYYLILKSTHLYIGGSAKASHMQLFRIMHF